MPILGKGKIKVVINIVVSIWQTAANFSYSRYFSLKSNDSQRKNYKHAIIRALYLVIDTKRNSHCCLIEYKPDFL